MTNKQLVKVLGIIVAVIAVIAVGVQVWIYKDNQRIAAQGAVNEVPASSSTAVSSSSSSTVITSKVVASSSSSKAQDTYVTDENGDVTIVKPEYEKPEAPSSKPELANSEALTDPTTPPTYTETPPVDNTPQPGVPNENGEVYVPGFGWMPDEGEGGEWGVAENAGTGDIIGF